MAGTAGFSGAARRLRGVLAVSALLFAGPILAPACGVRAEDLPDYPHYDSPAKIPAGAFANLPSYASVQLSPNGRRAAILIGKGGRYVIQIADFDAPEGTPFRTIGTVSAKTVRNVIWANDAYLLLEEAAISYDFMPLLFDMSTGSTWITSVDVESGVFRRVLTLDASRLKALPYETVLHTLPEEENKILVAYSPDQKSYPGVYKLDIVTGAIELVEPGQKPIRGWLADHDGKIRFGWSNHKGALRLIARASSDAQWRDLSSSELFRDGRFRPQGYDVDGQSLIVVSSAMTGRFGLYRVNLEDGRLRDKIFEHDRVDVTSVIQSRKRRIALAAVYTDDRLRYAFFDPEFETVLSALEAAAPDRSNHLMGTSASEDVFAFYSTSDTFPGEYLRYDQKSGEIRTFLKAYPDIDPRHLSPMRAVRFFARDGLEIPGFLTVPKDGPDKGLPAIILPHNEPNERISIGYGYLTQFLASRGYAVFEPNYRGSYGYGMHFAQLGEGQWGLSMQDDLADAAAYLVEEGVADPSRICIFGQGYAAYAALMGVIRQADPFACAAAVNARKDLVGWAKAVKTYQGGAAYASIAGARAPKELRAVSPLHQVDAIARPILLLEFLNQGKLTHDTAQFINALNQAGKPYRVATLDGKIYFDGVTARVRVLNEIERFLAEQIGRPADASPEPASARLDVR